MLPVPVLKIGVLNQKRGAGSYVSFADNLSGSVLLFSCLAWSDVSYKGLITCFNCNTDPKPAGGPIKRVNNF